MTVVRSRGNCLAWLRRALLAGLALALAACHGSNIPAPGTPVVTLGDTSGDFASYTVTIDSITLTADDGSVAGLMATPELVDLVKLTDFSELLGAPAAASGTYKSAAITVDYSSSAIYINNNGHAQLCSGRTPTGTALAPQVITITFDPAHPLVITQGKSSRVAIDFDLAASNSINTAVSPCVVTVRPFATMRPAAVDSTVLRARGLLVATEPASSDFVMNTRPLFDLVSIGIGAVTVKVTDTTYYNVNGVTLVGTAGLDSLHIQGVNLPIVAYGTLGDLSGITPTFNATAVYAGTSLESPIADTIQGVIGARSGNTLTVRGAFFLTRNGIISFADSAAVTVGPNTIVSEDGVAAAGLSIASVSVGQVMTVSGQGSVATTGAISLDATAGQVRLASTRLWGALNSATAGSLSLNTQTFANYAPGGFNFAGTGSGAVNADPAAYQVNTGALDATAITAGTVIAVDGIVTPFGAAPPDFNASAITQGSSTPQKLVVEWSAGSAHPFLTIQPSGLLVNLADPALSIIHYISTGPDRLELKTLPAAPVITTVGAPNQNDLRLAIGNTTVTTGISMFASAADYATAVNAALNGTTKVYRLVAVGQYNSATNTFVASSISVALHE